MVDDLDEIAAGRPIACVIGKGLLVLDRPVGMDSKASFGLCAEVGLESRSRSSDEPLELGSLRGVKTGWVRRSPSLQAHLLGVGGASSMRAACRMRPSAMSSSSSVVMGSLTSSVTSMRARLPAA